MLFKSSRRYFDAVSLKKEMKKKTKHPTLSEVARKAGVGTTTVSRVINGGLRVDPETKARVLRAIKSLGYVPNHAARILKGYRTRTIGLIIPSISDPFFSSCADAVQAVARANDSLLIVTTTQNTTASEIESLNVLIRHRADGLIIAPSSSRSLALRDALQNVAVPVVALDRPVLTLPITSVLTNNLKSAQLATEHLIAHGYRRIVCVTGELNLYTIQERVRGYRKAMQAAGLECRLETSVIDYQTAQSALEALLDGPDRPEAIFTLKNSATIYVFEELQRLHTAIPKSVALLGFDDFEFAPIVRPSISVVQQPIQEMGRVAAEVLFERLQKSSQTALRNRASHAKQVIVPTQFIPRISCGCTGAAD